MLQIYTDGSCLHGGSGAGYAAVFVREGVLAREVRGFLQTTNIMRAEMMGDIAALEALAEPSEVTVYSDSLPTVNGAKGVAGRRKNGDLWLRLDAAAARHMVRFRWVRGHSGNPWNQAAHRLCVRAARGGPKGEAPAAC